MQRGDVYSIPVKGLIENKSLNTLKIFFTFNSYIIDIKSAAGKNNYFFRDANPVINVDYSSPESATLTVTGTDINYNASDTLFILHIEGLAGPDSLTELKPFSLEIDGKINSNVELSTGLIKVLTSPVIHVLIEGFGNIYPNPFSDETKIIFYLSDDSEVNFSIYQLNGRQIYSLPEKANKSNYLIFDSKGSVVNDPINKIFGKGRYMLQLLPKNFEFPSGMYTIVMTTSRGSYKQNIMLAK
jgi:hypothetical protein